MRGVGENVGATALLLEGISRRLDEVIKLLRRIDCRLASKPIPDDLKDIVFDGASPNGRLT